MPTNQIQINPINPNTCILQDTKLERLNTVNKTDTAPNSETEDDNTSQYSDLNEQALLNNSYCDF